MDTLEDIFNHFDYDKVGKIDCVSFKIIINIIDMPIIDCTNNYYEYSDLINYIKKIGKKN